MGVANRVCLVNENEAIKWRNLENPLPDARFLAITLIQAALQHILYQKSKIFVTIAVRVGFVNFNEGTC